MMVTLVWFIWDSGWMGKVGLGVHGPFGDLEIGDLV